MARKENKYQKLALDLLGTRPIAFNPDLARALGSATAGLFMSQILYWWKKGRDPEMIYKTVKELEEETALTKTQQLNAQKICVRKGVLKVTYKGIPPKRHFRIDMERILELLGEIGGKEVSPKVVPERQENEHTNIFEGFNYISGTLPNITENTSTEDIQKRSPSGLKNGKKPFFGRNKYL